MSAIVNAYLNQDNYTKAGFGACIAGSASWVFGVTNPLPALALFAGGQALAWMPDLARRCLRSVRNRNLAVHVPRPVPAQNDARRAPAARQNDGLRFRNINGERSDDEAMHAAIEASQNVRQFPDQFDLAARLQVGAGQHRAPVNSDEAYQRRALDRPGQRQSAVGGEDEKRPMGQDEMLALQLSLEAPDRPKYKCAVQMMLDGLGENDKSEIAALPDIPEEFLVDAGNGRYYHAGRYIVSMMTQKQAQDVFNRAPLSEDQMEALAVMMGIDRDDFSEIWLKAEYNKPVGITESAYRMQQLYELLAAIGSPEENRRRDQYRAFIASQRFQG